ncbi:hypothetical protein B0H14DRAFT_3744970 [Mycena olivaceomarginata]|nr:hypothetical protein B0H14DRAFT_3744970 [Mycena olivaceomarginata]
MSTDQASSSPLQDRTNQPAAEAAPDLVTLQGEIVRLKSLVDTFSSRRGRGRKKRARCVLLCYHRKVKPLPISAATTLPPTPDPDPKRTKTAGTDYFAYGQTIGRLLGCHIVLGHVVEHGLHMDTALSGDEGEPNPRLEEGWKILCGKFPGFHQYLLELSKEPTTRRAIVKQMSLDWLLEDPVDKLEPPLPNKKEKIHRGLAHPAFARALTPMVWEANESTWTEIVEGEKQITADQLPIFIFPCAQAAKAIYMGPDAALEGDGYHKGKPGNASIIGMTSFTPRTIAGVVTQVRFALSSKQDWSKRDGEFDYEAFFWMVHDLLFEDTDLADDIIGLGITRTTASGPSALAQIKAARTAHKQAATAATGTV